ncbi:MAG: mersacidin/lichenicidin family type 2 lantibiotic [Coleofasciculus sp. A1-SPW-01]|uniref:mersacidin/lichenicidin family type 2 lantibiotic n=1 Tax=Coleofasciculus sp. A1-SPW-01 TaxID=3070819 RepID=UPI00330494FC
MANIDIIRAWKDEEFRNSLSEEQKAQLPDNPAGLVDLTDEEINGVQGGFTFASTLKGRCGAFFTATAECYCPKTIWWCRR